MIFKFGFFYLLILTSFVFGQVDPYKVAKDTVVEEIEIPEGMHLVNTRTGEMWVLAIGETEPPAKVRELDYFVQKEKVEVKGIIDGVKVYDKPISAEETFVDPNLFWSKLTKHFRKLLNSEKDLNLHGQSNHFSFLGDYSPSSKTPFYLPYIPIPEEEMDFNYISEKAQDKTKKLVKFEKDGRVYYRMFIHPNYPHSYKELIKKHGIVYDYIAMTTSSPRSLIVLDPNKANEVHWVKVSLPKKIDGSVRLNIDTKLRRAVIMSEALGNIPVENLDRYGVDIMLEPASLQPMGKKFGTIFREVHDELLYPARGKSWLPAFALNAPGDSGQAILTEMIEKSKMPAENFIKEHIVRPFLKAYLNLALVEGLPGEMHTQNFYYELNKKGLPTGRFIFKDNDGFRFDVELAMRNGRNLDYLSSFKRPFYWAKFSNALGTGREGVPFLGSWYYKLIRNVSGFETLSSYILQVVENSGQLDWDKDRIQRIFDDIAIEEAEKITGIKIDDSVRYGYGKGKGLNAILDNYRERLSNGIDTDVWKSDESLQGLLREVFIELEENKAVHSRSGAGKNSYFIPYKMRDGTFLIEARSTSGRKSNPTQAIGIVKVNSENTRILEERIGSRFKFEKLVSSSPKCMTWSQKTLSFLKNLIK